MRVLFCQRPYVLLLLVVILQWVLVESTDKTKENWQSFQNDLVRFTGKDWNDFDSYVQIVKNILDQYEIIVNQEEDASYSDKENIYEQVLNEFPPLPLKSEEIEKLVTNKKLNVSLNMKEFTSNIVSDAKHDIMIKSVLKSKNKNDDISTKLECILGMNAHLKVDSETFIQVYGYVEHKDFYYIFMEYFLASQATINTLFENFFFIIHLKSNSTHQTLFSWESIIGYDKAILLRNQTNVSAYSYPDKTLISQFSLGFMETYDALNLTGDLTDDDQILSNANMDKLKELTEKKYRETISKLKKKLNHFIEIASAKIQQMEVQTHMHIENALYFVKLDSKFYGKYIAKSMIDKIKITSNIHKFDENSAHNARIYAENKNPQTSNSKYTGQVSKWISSQGYGFIRMQDQKTDLYVHINDVESKNHLILGEIVTFYVYYNNKTGLEHAIQVQSSGDEHIASKTTDFTDLSKTEPINHHFEPENTNDIHKSDQKMEHDDRILEENENLENLHSKYTGKVCKWIPSRGYGFIRMQGQETDFYFHINDVESKDHLNIEETVTFNVGYNNKTGLQNAINIKGSGDGYAASKTTFFTGVSETEHIVHHFQPAYETQTEDINSIELNNNRIVLDLNTNQSSLNDEEIKHQPEVKCTKGTVCKWIPSGGYGFICTQDQKNNLYFHINDVESKTNLNIGETVTFNVCYNNKTGLQRAIQIKGNGDGYNASKTTRFTGLSKTERIVHHFQPAYDTQTKDISNLEKSDDTIVADLHKSKSSLDKMLDSKYTGVVWKWLARRGYGFIHIPDQKHDLYVHISDVESKDNLHIGETVTFNVCYNYETGLYKAIQVKGKNDAYGSSFYTGLSKTEHIVDDFQLDQKETTFVIENSNSTTKVDNDDTIVKLNSNITDTNSNEEFNSDDNSPQTLYSHSTLFEPSSVPPANVHTTKISNSNSVEVEIFNIKEKQNIDEKKSILLEKESTLKDKDDNSNSMYKTDIKLMGTHQDQSLVLNHEENQKLNDNSKHKNKTVEKAKKKSDTIESNTLKKQNNTNLKNPIMKKKKNNGNFFLKNKMITETTSIKHLDQKPQVQKMFYCWYGIFNVILSKSFMIFKILLMFLFTSVILDFIFSGQHLNDLSYYSLLFLVV